MDIIAVNTTFFVLASLSCVIGAIIGVLHALKIHARRPLYFFNSMILAYLALIYGLAALARCGMIETPIILKNGILTSLGVFLLSTLFTIMFTVTGDKNGR